MSQLLTKSFDAIRDAGKAIRSAVYSVRMAANFQAALRSAVLVWGVLYCGVLSSNETLSAVPESETSVATDSHDAAAVLAGNAENDFETSAAAVTTVPVVPCGADLEYWVVNTRRLGCWRGPQFGDAGPAFAVSRYLNAERRWQTSSTAELIAAAQVVRPTWVLIHGNRFNSQDAIDYGWLAARTLAFGRAADRPVRVIIWSWPSDQIHGAIQDVQAKAARTASDSIYLSWLADHLPHETPLCIVASSLGVRIGTGAMHLLSGGSLSGYALPHADLTRTPMRAIFNAAALHDYWLLPNSVHGRALNNVDQVLFLNNCCDQVLKRYRFIEDCGNPAAAGYSGARLTAAQMAHVRQMNVCNCVGKTHDYTAYFYAGNLAAQMRAVAAFAEPAAAK